MATLPTISSQLRKGPCSRSWRSFGTHRLESRSPTLSTSLHATTPRLPAPCMQLPGSQRRHPHPMAAAMVAASRWLRRRPRRSVAGAGRGAAVERLLLLRLGPARTKLCCRGLWTRAAKSWTTSCARPASAMPASPAARAPRALPPWPPAPPRRRPWRRRSTTGASRCSSVRAAASTQMAKASRPSKPGASTVQWAARASSTTWPRFPACWACSSGRAVPARSSWIPAWTELRCRHWRRRMEAGLWAAWITQRPLPWHGSVQWVRVWSLPPPPVMRPGGCAGG
mmetsp:Transcript_162166/g.520056  ORF Transcript_162166/g.520056 Transcript_162166/m.520056 type:complete len:283 (+) Transcript_162166:1442-2290(+)